MRWPEELKEEFRNRYQNGELFTPNDIITMIKPYVEFDPEAAEQAFYTDKVGSFAASFKSKDKDGVIIRDIFSFMLDGQKGWASIGDTDNVDILKAQKAQLVSRLFGLHRSIEKINKKIASLGVEQPQQMKLFDEEMMKIMETYTEIDNSIVAHI